MKIQEFITILLCSFAIIIGYQLGTQNVSFWIIIFVAFCLGILLFVLLNFKKLSEVKK